MATHYEADDLLEQGVMAELDGHPKPELFHKALEKFEETSSEMKRLDADLGELIAIHKKGKPVAAFEQSLTRVLAQAKGLERVGASGRYANVGGGGGPPAQRPVANLLDIMEAQRSDLHVLQKQMDETIATFRSVIPLAEKGRFVPMMLSGRAGFSSKIQQAVSLIGQYGRFYTSSCMATIEATMQAYPAGFAWLPDVPPGLSPPPSPPPPGPTATDAGPRPSVQDAAARPAPPPPKKPGGGCCQTGSTSPESAVALIMVCAALWQRRSRRRRG